jgi:hypothetical protein
MTTQELAAQVSVKEEKRRRELPAFIKSATIAAFRTIVLDGLDGVHFGG